MKEICDLKEKQQIALGVLLFFSSFCESHDIKYSLSYGTLLGAVRHKGFIPWDDDVDVMMLREDYDLFLEQFDNNIHPYYRFISMHNNNKYFAPLAKLYDNRTIVRQAYGQDEKVEYGIYIDIFIVDKLPDDYKDAEKFYKSTQMLRRFWGLSVKRLSSSSRNVMVKVISLLPMLLCKVMGYKFFLKKYDELSKKYNTTNSKHAGVIIYGEGIKKEFFPLSLYKEHKKIKFENYEFWAIKDADTYLCQMYGDYMQIPDEKDRKIHPSCAFWKN